MASGHVKNLAAAQNTGARDHAIAEIDFVETGKNARSKWTTADQILQILLLSVSAASLFLAKITSTGAMNLLHHLRL